MRRLPLTPVVALMVGLIFPPPAGDREARFISFSVKQKNGVYVRDLRVPLWDG